MEDSMEKIWANSGDSHILEPEDVLYRDLPRRLAERMPRTEKSDDGRWETVYVDGKTIRRRLPKPIQEGEMAGMTFVDALMRPPGARDPRARIADLDQEGIWGEVIYPSLTLWNTFIEDPVLAREAARAINDWTASEVLSVSPRLVATAQLSLRDIGDAVAEIQRAADLGFNAVFIPTGPPVGEPPFHNDHWEPLWAAAAEAGMILSVHIGTDSDPVGADTTGPGGFDVLRYKGPGGAILNYVDTTWTGQRIACQLVAGGALDRHPSLKLLVSEGGAAWVPFLGDRMNEAFRQHAFAVAPKLSRSPKEILFEQVYASFQHDETAVAAMTAMGYRNVIWGSDYPHIEGTYGHTQELLHELFEGLDHQVRRRITVEAFLDLFPRVGEPRPELVSTEG
jgi:predicted TIM-barrel fold metal-dependent hydrolase